MECHLVLHAVKGAFYDPLWLAGLGFWLGRHCFSFHWLLVARSVIFVLFTCWSCFIPTPCFIRTLVLAQQKYLPPTLGRSSLGCTVVDFKQRLKVHVAHLHCANHFKKTNYILLMLVYCHNCVLLISFFKASAVIVKNEQTPGMWDKHARSFILAHWTELCDWAVIDESTSIWA